MYWYCKEKIDVDNSWHWKDIIEVRGVQWHGHLPLTIFSQV